MVYFGINWYILRLWKHWKYPEVVTQGVRLSSINRIIVSANTVHVRVLVHQGRIQGAGWVQRGKCAPPLSILTHINELCVCLCVCMCGPTPLLCSVQLSLASLPQRHKDFILIRLCYSQIQSGNILYMKLDIHVQCIKQTIYCLHMYNTCLAELKIYIKTILSHREESKKALTKTV